MKRFFSSLALMSALALFTPTLLHAHCDTLDGPVVTDAKTALQKGDVTPVLKWVRPADEKEVRDAFNLAIEARKNGGASKELADRYFFETLVRVHRAGEGAGFEGLKPAGSVEPGIAAADKALDAGSGESLEKMVADHVAHGIHERFAKTAELKKHANDSVEAGRQYVAAYVDFIHYVEGIHQAAMKSEGHAHEEAPEHVH